MPALCPEGKREVLFYIAFFFLSCLYFEIFLAAGLAQRVLKQVRNIISCASDSLFSLLQGSVELQGRQWRQETREESPGLEWAMEMKREGSCLDNGASGTISG